MLYWPIQTLYVIYVVGWYRNVVEKKQVLKT